MILLAITQAFALDCTHPDYSGDACHQVNTVADLLLDQTGTAIISDGATQARFRSANLYARFETMLDAIDDASCGPPGYANAGVYDGSGAGVGNWRGLAPGPATGDVAVDIDFANRTFLGTFTMGAGFYGNWYAAYNDRGKVLTQWTDPDQAVSGFWLRTTGRNGVWVALEMNGDCPTSVQTALGGWFGSP